VKKIIVLATIAVFAASLVFVYTNAAFAAEAKDKPAAAEVKKVEDKKAAEPKVMCKFKTKGEMQEFEKLYAAKQATFTRMNVLQVYFSVEQTNLQEIDKQMEKKFNFKMDPKKMYDLNRTTMEIKETGDAPQQAAQQ
jgi:CTP synthase (UTP-ammonia lyase)